MKQAGSTTYLVNGLGQRVRKNTGSDTYFAYDEAGRLIGEYDATGAAIQETVWLGDIPVATIRPKQPSGYDVFYVWTDNLNTPRAVSDATNQLRWTWEPNDPFGKTAPNENPAGVGAFAYNLRFPGQYFDAETGTHYNYFRDYDPGMGRYVQSDPIGLRAGTNTFGYVKGNPIAAVDARGLLTGYKNCTSRQRSEIEKGEQQLKDFVRNHCKGCAAASGKCVDCAFAHFMLMKLATDSVECASSDWTVTLPNGNSVRAGGSAPVPGTGMTLYPALFENPGQYRCLASTLFHEEMHLMGIGHPDPGKGFDPDDPVYSTELSCVRAGLCGRSAP